MDEERRKGDDRRAGRQADFFECEDGTLVVCPVGQTPNGCDGRHVGTGTTTLEYGDCG